MLWLPLAHAGHWYVGLIYLAPVTVLAITLLVIGRRDRRAEARERRQGSGHQDVCDNDADGHRA